MAFVALAAFTVQPVSTASAATVYCEQYKTIPVAEGRYIVDNNNYGKGVKQCVSTDGTDSFTVTSSNAAASPPSSPVSYPEIFEGCHWNTCTAGSKLPLRVDTIGSSTSSWSTTLPSTGNFNVSYDLWFNTTPTTPKDNGQPDGAELMIWLNQRSSADSPAGTYASVGGKGYHTWQLPMEGNGRKWPLLGYRMDTPTTSVNNLDLRAFIRDAVVRGVVKPDWYLIAVEAGFETWSGGEGLRTNAFSSASAVGYPVGAVRSGITGGCMNNYGDRLVDGNPVVLGFCTDTTGQKWTISMDGTIRHRDRCLGTTGAKVSLNPCNGSPYQIWQVGLHGALWNHGAAACLRAPGGAIGTQLDLADCNGAANEAWKLPSTLAAQPY
ncbi:GH12 family glycosyl hydrolase domain-containing protein [Streptosporangium sp. CA-135522]|uniref:GH12 family glycosyl hydrolase domain-containing protein n=1 Tax=Streptosporangium sp. CA-135522 TaxID=3240072 RepID=UPI003D8EB5DF